MQDVGFVAPGLLRLDRLVRQVRLLGVPTTRSECRTLENQFLDRFERHLQNLKMIHTPLQASSYDCTNGVRREIDQEPEVRALLRRAGNPKIYDEMPINRCVIVEITRKPLFGARRPVVDLIAASSSPLDELVFRGVAEKPAGSRDISVIRERVVTQPKVFHYLALFSPTGWTEEARRDLIGANFVIALIDWHSGGFRSYVPEDARTFSRKAFDVSSYHEKLDMLRTLLRSSIHELLVGEFTSDYVHKQFFLPIDLIETLFEDMVVEDKFLVLDARSRPIRLMREYARAGFPAFQDIFDQSELLKYRDALDRDEERIQCILSDLQKLSEKEEELLDEGARADESRRRMLAHWIKRLRRKHRELQARLAIFQKRHSITAQYVNTLELIRAVRMESTPDLQRLESIIAQASVAREKLKELVEAAQAAQSTIEKSEDSPEVDRIMAELQSENPEAPPERETEPETETPPPEPVKPEREEIRPEPRQEERELE
jgi:hypothetical protein